MNKHEVMDSFTPLWWTSIAIVCLSIILLLLLPKYTLWARHKYYRKSLSLLLLSNLVIENCYGIYLGNWSVQDNLPLHLCGISAIISIVLLFKYNHALAQVLYYWGLTGGFYSLLTPEFDLGMNGFFFYAYFISHGGLILTCFYAIVHDGFKPEKGSWLSSFLLVQSAAVVAGIFNWASGSNYMYLSKPPIVDNPLIMGEWPWYIFVFEVLAFFHFLVLYLLFDFTVFINRKQLLFLKKN
ncbi:MAG: TIGR02206 family membrane protein [bacterium]|jgi:hypothetical integral membrane protein (TIGR02206 family)